MGLEGQVALITGATSGIGLAAARRMAAAGMKLAIGGRRADLLRDFEQHPSKMQDIRQPLTPEDVARGIMFALEQPPHVLVPRVLMLPREQPM